MHLMINGQSRDIPLSDESPVLTSLIDALGLGDRRVAVEVNARVVRRAEHGRHHLAEGDVIEIVHFVGGG